MKQLRVTERDLEVLYHISTQNFASISELYSLFWTSKKSSKAHHKRLLRLKEHGLIESLNGPQNAKAGYTITLKGQNLLRVHDYHVVPCVVKKDVYRGSYEHDILVNTLKNILLKSPIIENFIPEYQLANRLFKSFRDERKLSKEDKIPDGLFTLYVRGKPLQVALEVELSLKSLRRYRTIFAKHLLANSWDTVFYIVKDEVMREKLLGHIKELMRTNFLLKTEKKVNKIYFSLLDEVLKKGELAIFKDSKIEFNLKLLEQKVS